MKNFRRLDTASLKAFDKILGPSLERVPTKTTSVIARLIPHLGVVTTVARVVAAYSKGASDPEVRALVIGNLGRQQTRLPAIFKPRPVAAAYLHIKAAQASLLRDLLLLGQRNDTVDLVFNGSVYPESVLAAVSDVKRRLFIEAGFLPNTMQADPLGLNGANSVPRDPSFYLQGPHEFGTNGLPTATSRRASKSKHTPIDLPASYIFVPFQVPSDMQITRHSPWLRDMAHFLAVIRAAADRNPSEVFVIKEHPSFRASVMHLFKPHPRVIFANGNMTDTLIAKSRAVITINSTVGIEALQAGKPVITLGVACYNIAGLVLQARDEPSLDAAIARTGWRPDDRLRRQFLGFLHNVYLVPGTYERPPASLAADLQARLTGQQSAWHTPTAENQLRKSG